MTDRAAAAVRGEAPQELGGVAGNLRSGALLLAAAAGNDMVVAIMSSGRPAGAVQVVTERQAVRGVPGGAQIGRSTVMVRPPSGRGWAWMVP